MSDIPAPMLRVQLGDWRQYIIYLGFLGVSLRATYPCQCLQ